MRIGIDSYCYHRWFGELYPGLERDPGRRIDIWQFLDIAAELGVQGVSLETCYLPPALDHGALRARLAASGLEAVWAWGHPLGLGSGARPEALDDLIHHIGQARAAGAAVMRICAGGRRSRPAGPWAAHRDALLPLLRRAADAAQRQDVVLAVENHLDLLAEELAELVETVASPALGVCLDTANNLRMGEDPVAVARRLAPFARATHVKTVRRRDGTPGTMAEWPSASLDRGEVDIPAVLATLRAAGYRGLLALEIDYLDPAEGEDVAPAIARSLQALRGWL